MRRAFREAKLEGLRLSFTDCLGPCSEANVIFFYALGRPYWFRRINSPELIAALIDFARAATDGGAKELVSNDLAGAVLASHAFTWTGGGPGPEPPVVDSA